MAALALLKISQLARSGQLLILPTNYLALL
jgi:hypothetical protein